MEFKVCSSAFSQGEMLPEWYYIESMNASPPMGWDGEPARTASLALVCRSSAGRIHWVCWNIPNTLKTIYGMQPGEEKLADGIIQGVNDFGHTGWTGPGRANFGMTLTFHLYALDSMLELTDSQADETKLMEALKEHVLKETTLSCECG